MFQSPAIQGLWGYLWLNQSGISELSLTYFIVTLIVTLELDVYIVVAYELV